MKKGFLEVIEKQEILQILENSGFGEKIEAL
jgi:hypothetical protein